MYVMQVFSGFPHIGSGPQSNYLYDKNVFDNYFMLKQSRRVRIGEVNGHQNK